MGLGSQRRVEGSTGKPIRWGKRMDGLWEWALGRAWGRWNSAFKNASAFALCDRNLYKSLLRRRE